MPQDKKALRWLIWFIVILVVVLVVCLYLTVKPSFGGTCEPRDCDRVIVIDSTTKITAVAGVVLDSTVTVTADTLAGESSPEQ